MHISYRHSISRCPSQCDLRDPGGHQHHSNECPGDNYVEFGTRAGDRATAWGIDNSPLENGGWPTNYIVGVEIISGYTADPFIIDLLGPAPGGEVQYTAGYSEFTEAKNGITDYSKRFSADTVNKVPRVK